MRSQLLEVGTRYSPRVLLLIAAIVSYLEMMSSAAASFSASVFEPPPETASTMPALNLNLGGVNVSLGGAAGTGVYRTSGENSVSVQADNIRDGVKNLLGKIKLPGP
jgi:vacuolar protein sorting-associated protein 45